MSDARTTLARPNLADERLEGLVRADRYGEAHALTCRAPFTAVRRAPEAASEQQDQLLFGERFRVLETGGDWAWGQADRDGYVGFVRREDLAAPGEPPTHRVAARLSIGFSAPDLKSAPVQSYPMSALLTVEAAENGFLRAGEAGWLFEAHLRPVGDFADDPAGIAEAFIGAPYLWGGRGGLGLDCSGLVQQALHACGRACPRDTDQQLAVFAAEAPRGALARGDLVFWKGHVGIMLDAERIIHANAHHMATAVEPLEIAVKRIVGAGSGEPIGFRRP